MGSRLMRQAQNEVESDDEEADADDTNDDPDYIANDSDSDANANYESDFSHDDSSDLEEELADLITDTQDQQPLQQQTFLGDLLQSLCELKRGKIDWSDLLEEACRVHENGS